MSVSGWAAWRQPKTINIPGIRMADGIWNGMAVE